MDVTLTECFLDQHILVRLFSQVRFRSHCSHIWMIMMMTEDDSLRAIAKACSFASTVFSRRVYEGVKHVIALFHAAGLAIPSIAHASVNDLTTDIAFRVDTHLLSRQLLRDRVQSLGNLSEIVSALLLLSLNFICSHLDALYASLHATKLLITSYLRL